MMPVKETLPPELLELKQFILWYEEDKGGKKTKIPAAPWKTGHWKATSATDPANWTDFDTAEKYANEKEGYGIGFSFKENGGIVGIDLDGCIEEGKLNSFAMGVIKETNSYTELSPSEKGLHVFVKGEVADKVVKDEKIEIYAQDRYFTLTGRKCLDTPCVLNPAQDFLDEMFAKYYKTPPTVTLDKESENNIPIVTLLDVSAFRRHGKQLQGTHPVHGSETGMNFSVHEEKNVWHCYRHKTGGGPLSLLGMLKGIVKCEECVPGRIRGEEFKKIMNIAKVEIPSFEWEEEKGITDKAVTDAILEKHHFYCEKEDPDTLLYIWNNNVWHNGVAEGMVLNELSGIFAGEESRAGMQLEKTINFIKGIAMNVKLDPKPPEMIAFRNGIYNLKTSELSEHDRKYFYTNLVPHDCAPSAVCPRFLKWLSEVIRPEDVPFLQEWMGYLFYTKVVEAAFLILVGTGQNGKTILMDMLIKILGEENVTNISLAALTYDIYERAEIYHKMANISDDIGSEVIRNAGKLKAASSGSMMTVQRKFGQPHNIHPYLKLMYAANEPPEIKDQTEAIKMRLKTIEFPYVFSKTPGEGDKPARDREEIEAELTEEIPGIINWALEGLKRLSANKFKFSASRSTEETWVFYQRKSNPVLAFVDECINLTQDEGDKITPETLYNAFCEWVEGTGIKMKVKRVPFFKKLKEEGIETRQKAEDERKRFYYGITVTVSRHIVLPLFPREMINYSIYLDKETIKRKRGRNKEPEKKRRRDAVTPIPTLPISSSVIRNITLPQLVFKLWGVVPFKESQVFEKFPDASEAQQVIDYLYEAKTQGKAILTAAEQGANIWRLVG